MPSRTAGRPRLPYTLALAALLPALPCHADGGDGVPWQPVRALLEPASGPPQASAPQPVPPHSALRCVGVDVDSRACHFKNLYYDRHRARFVVFGEPPSSASDEDAYHPGSRSGRDGDVLRIRRVDPPVRPVQPVLPGWAPPKPFLQLGGCALALSHVPLARSIRCMPMCAHARARAGGLGTATSRRATAST